MIDGEINAGRGEMKRGIELTWRCNAPLARDLTGTWAAAASPRDTAILLVNNISLCQSELLFFFFFGRGELNVARERNCHRNCHRCNLFIQFEV